MTDQAAQEPTLPSSYKACLYSKPGENAIEIKTDMPIPEPGPGEVLVHLTHSGVCSSDLAVMTNAWKALPYPTQPGQIGGHEGVGSVVKLGLGSEKHRKIGERVGIKWIAFACGTCRKCLAGHEGACTAGRKISGYYTPGTFQQYILAPASYVTPIPDGIDNATAAPMLCAGVTVFSALRRANVGAGSTVAVLGAAGGLGHLAIQIAAKGMGLRVIGIDHSSKEELVKSCGAEKFVGFDKVENLPDAVKAASSKDGVDVALVTVGSNAVYGQALSMLAHNGKLVCVGVPEGDPAVIAGAFPTAMIFKEISIVGSAVGNRFDAVEVLDMAARGIVRPHIKVEKMDKLQDVFDELKGGKIMGRVVIDLT